MGILGMRKSAFDGNSVALANLMTRLPSLEHLSISARLKILDAETLTKGLADSTFQLKSLKLSAICLNETSVLNLTQVFINQKSLLHLTI